MLPLVLSAVLFGAVSAGTYYGVNQLLPQDDGITSVESSASSGAMLTSLASTSYSGTRYGMDVSDIAASDTLSQIAIIAAGDSNTLEAGEQVVAIGNALGYGQSVTTGIVSAVNRSLANAGGAASTYIKTDSAINTGNSGGALLNLDGELIGINTAKLSDTDVEGMGYAIPISDTADLIIQLMAQTTEPKMSLSRSWQGSYM